MERRAPSKVASPLEQRPEVRNMETVKVGLGGTEMAWPDGFRDHQRGTAGSSITSPGEGLRGGEEALAVGCGGETCQEIGWERLEMK